MAEVVREIGDEGVEACAVGSSGGVRETRRTVGDVRFAGGDGRHGVCVEDGGEDRDVFFGHCLLFRKIGCFEHTCPVSA